VRASKRENRDELRAELRRLQESNDVCASDLRALNVELRGIFTHVKAMRRILSHALNVVNSRADE
jgi:hypothetical protein